MCSSKIAVAIGTSAGVRDPGAVVAVLHLAQLVGAHLLERLLVGGRVVLIGICAAIPPIACAPRRWQVLISSCVYARMNGCCIVTCARSGSTQAGSARSFLIKLKM